jgi:hypothetical protein
MATLQLNDTAAAALSAQAAAHGLSVDAYLESILFPVPTHPMPRLSVDELDRLLDEEATKGPSPCGTFSRAELYGEQA